jgi:hypothetical protein
VISIYCMLLLPICSGVIGLFGFWIGRCARKLPIIDDKLPWTAHRDQIVPTEANTAKHGSGPPRWP